MSKCAVIISIGKNVILMKKYAMLYRNLGYFLSPQRILKPFRKEGVESYDRYGYDISLRVAIEV